jgi:hypothetical protein
VVGVDGSPGSIEALRWALRQATATGATVEAICAWESPSIAELTPPVGVPAVVHQPVVDVPAVEGVQRRLEEVIESAVGSSASRGEVPIAAKVIEGHPAHVLVQVADRAELLVVCRSGHGAFVGMLLGAIGAQASQPGRQIATSRPVRTTASPP